MININPTSISIISYNKCASNDTLCFLPGGTAVTMDANSKAHLSYSGMDSAGLGRWTWTWLEDKYETFATYLSTYGPYTQK